MDFGNIFVFLSILQATLLILLLLFKKKVQFPTQYLIYLLVGLLYFQIEFLLVRNAAKLPSNLFLLTPHGGWLLIGPLLYFFIKSIYQKDRTKNFIAHLLPFLVITIILPLFLQESVPKRGFDYGMLSVFTYSKLGLTTSNSFYGIVFFLQFIHLAVYIALSYQFNQQQVDMPFSRFINRLLGLSTIIYFGCLIFYGALLASSFYTREWDYFLILPTVILVYFISYHFLAYPEWWRSDIKITNGKKYERSELPEEELNAIMKLLDSTVKDQKLYKDASLSLESVAQIVDVSRHKVSQAINRQRDIAFNDYINQFRIEEVKQLMKKYNGEQSILSMAFEAGFNNKATFNKYFKKITGQTPSEFKKSLKKE